MAKKFKAFGAESTINQIDRIRSGFLELNLTESDTEPDFVYVNDVPSIDKALEFKKRCKNSPKTIFTTLDIPIHLLDPKKYDLSRYSGITHPWERNFNAEELAAKLKLADFRTCICDEVKLQLSKYAGIDDAITIYNPVKPTSFLNLPDYQKIKNRNGQLYKYLFIGRARDFGKRYSLIISTLGILGEGPDKIAVVGSEDPYFGDYYNVVDDETLNLFYNSCEYLFMPSFFKSIGLPLLEKIISGYGKFLVTSDDPCSSEFAPGLSIEPTPQALAAAIKSPVWNEKCQKFVNDHSEEYRQKFSPIQICKNILALL